jgi:MarR family transcriptional regulator, 2-MHQ and catechol-resistance regulon repressor
VELFSRLVEVEGRLERRLGADLEGRCGLPYAWFQVLRRLGDQEDEQLTMGELAQQVGLTTGGVTRLVDRMVAGGHVERIASATDRRVLFAALTDKGKATLSEASEVHAADVRAVFEGFSDRELAVFGRLLDRLV